MRKFLARELLANRIACVLIRACPAASARVFGPTPGRPRPREDSAPTPGICVSRGHGLRPQPMLGEAVGAWVLQSWVLQKAWRHGRCACERHLWGSANGHVHGRLPQHAWCRARGLLLSAPAAPQDVCIAKWVESQGASPRVNGARGRGTLGSMGEGAASGAYARHAACMDACM